MPTDTYQKKYNKIYYEANKKKLKEKAKEYRQGCNLLLGQAKDDIMVLKNAIRYLNDFRKLNLNTR
jgi:hypothetical protein